MGRAIRPNVPGGVFHLTARTLRGQRWFTPAVRTRTLDVLARAVPASDIRLLAVTVMPNHLHLVVQQGRYRVGRFMQSLLRRIVHLIHREHGLEGPIFWRPYGYTPCLDAEHARNAIVYTHLNPVRARLCDDPLDYPWSSHELFIARADAAGGSKHPEAQRLIGLVQPHRALRLFAFAADRSIDDLCVDYQRFVAWRLAVDRWTEEERSSPLHNGGPEPLARCVFGSLGALSPLFHTRAAPSQHALPVAGFPDLADLARTTLAAASPRLDHHAIRGRRGGRALSRLRHLVILRAHAAGYRNADIARFLDLSESAVSKVVCADAGR
jgi:REP element-mobilizing transposase RayT